MIIWTLIPSNDGSNLQEGNAEGGDQPNVHHLDVGGLGQAVRHGDEHGGEHQHAGQVDAHPRPEVRGSEEVDSVGDGDQQQGGQVDSHHGAWRVTALVTQPWRISIYKSYRATFCPGPQPH